MKKNHKILVFFDGLGVHLGVHNQKELWTLKKLIHNGFDIGFVCKFTF